MEIKYKKTRAEGIAPKRGSTGAAGWDIYSPYETYILPGTYKTVPTGIAMEIPEGYFGAIYPRSGLASKKGLRLSNCVGVIDEDYRGEVGVPLYNDSPETQYIQAGERIAQLIIQPYMTIEFSEVEELSDTTRGEGGFGSTGTK